MATKRELMQNDSFMKHFRDLSSTDPEVRTQGAENLFLFLGDQSESTPEINYSLERLSRGLASSHEAARQGFGLALSELLRRYPFASHDEIFTTLEIRNKGKKNSREQVDYMNGLIFTIIAIERSGRLEKLASSKKEEFISLVTKMFQILKEASSTKSFLREISLQVTTSLLPLVKSDVFSKNVLPIFKAQLQEEISKLSPELLGLLINFYKFYKFDVKTISEHWSMLKKGENPLNETTFKHLVPIMKGCVYTTPRLHSVWELFLQVILPNKDEKKPSLSFFKTFWQDFVLDDLLGKTTTKSKKLMAFLIFQKLVPLITPPLLPIVFSETFLRHISNEINASKSPFQTVATEAFQEFALASANFEPEVVLNLLISFTNSPLASKLSKQIGQIEKCLDSKAAKSFVSHLKDKFYVANIDFDHERDINFEMKEDKVDYVRSKLLIKFFTLAKNSVIEGNFELLDSTIQFFIFYGYFKPKKEDITKKDLNGLNEEFARKFDPPLSTAVRRKCISLGIGLVKSLHKLSLSKPKGEKVKAESQEFNLLDNIFKKMRSLLDNKNFELITPLTEEQTNALDLSIKNLKATSEKLKDPDTEKASMAKVFNLMFSHIFFEFLSEPEDMSQIIPELEDLYKVFEKDDDKKEEKIVVFTDILLSLLSRTSAVVRSVVSIAFEMFTPHLNAEAIDLLTNVITSPPDSDVLQDEEPSQDADSADDDESDSDGGSDSSDDEDEEEEEEEKEVDAKAEGDKEVTAGSVEDMDDDENLPPATDEEMLKMDEKIADVLREAKKEKTDKIEMRTRLQNFKFKILELVNIYLKKQSSNPLLLKFVLPLLESMKLASVSPNEAPYFNSASKLFQKLKSTKPYPSNVQEQEATDLLNKVLTMLGASQSKQLSKVLCWAVVYLLKVTLHSHPTKKLKLFDAAVRDIVLRYFNRKKVFQIGSLLSSLFRRFPFYMIKAVLNPLITNACNNKHNFLVINAFQFLKELLTHAVAARSVINRAEKGENSKDAKEEEIKEKKKKMKKKAGEKEDDEKDLGVSFVDNNSVGILRDYLPRFTFACIQLVEQPYSSELAQKLEHFLSSIDLYLKLLLTYTPLDKVKQSFESEKLIGALKKVYANANVYPRTILNSTGSLLEKLGVERQSLPVLTKRKESDEKEPKTKSKEEEKKNKHEEKKKKKEKEAEKKKKAEKKILKRKQADSDDDESMDEEEKDSDEDSDDEEEKPKKKRKMNATKLENRHKNRVSKAKARQYKSAVPEQDLPKKKGKDSKPNNRNQKPKGKGKGSPQKGSPNKKHKK
eukprot:TRINITY_DN705_c6_g1_i1.p1 TRINITY_DN705_c6_g1~~TRINITY_DN705_c6_g1_i1.p1  ORF type:complete len:1292 (-),score=381.84 TRINITY_DN705_c6_g1_i1:44-3919(-)